MDNTIMLLREPKLTAHFEYSTIMVAGQLDNWTTSCFKLIQAFQLSSGSVSSRYPRREKWWNGQRSATHWEEVLERA